MTETPDTPRRSPRAPSGLGDAGKALWRTVNADYELSNTELAVLTAACRQADDLALLDAAIAGDGATVAGSQGQPRLNAALTEARQGRLALAKLLGALALPDEDDEPMTAAQKRAQKAGRSAARRRRAQRQRHAERAGAGVFDG